jgi:two-component system, response regulator
MNTDEMEILLVEDNEYDAELTVHALRRGNLVNNIVHLKDGAEALDFLFCEGQYSSKIPGKHPRVILLDLKMPKIDGIDVLERIKSDERTKAIPVVILTSSNEDPDVKKCYELGANSYIVKPVGFENFTKSVAQLGVYWLLLNHS